MERLRRRGRSGSSSRDSSRSSEVAAANERKFEVGSVESNRARKAHILFAGLSFFSGQEEGKKECGTTKPRSNSSSRSTSITREDDLHTSGLLAGTVVKKLLEDEMSRDIESRRRPSVIARLMGLDILPPPEQNANKQHKRTSDNGDSVKVGSSASHKYGKNQQHRSLKEQEQCRDVYEVAGSSKILGDGSSSHVSFNRRKSQDVAFHGKNFMDVKQLLTYEKFSDTTEFSDAFEMLGFNQDLLLRYVDQPDSLFAKHLQCLHDAGEHRREHDRCLHSGALNHNINAIGCQSGSAASRKIDISFSHKHKDGIQIRSCHKHDDSFQILSHYPSERLENPCLIPDKIVVLKPNLAKLQSKNSSSHDLLSDFAACKERYDRRRDVELWRKNFVADGLDMSQIDFRESRQMAREVTRRMKQKLEKGSLNASLNGYKGYSADESSYDMFGNDSSYESDGATVLPEMSLHRRSCNEASSSRYSGTSVITEAKKRLSERWKMTPRSCESDLVDKGSTLGEMLAIPELDTRLSNTEAISAHDAAYRFSRRTGVSGSTIPLTISSKDGWKDQSIGLSRSRSLPASSEHRIHPKTSMRHEALVPERFLIPKERSRCRDKTMRSSARIKTRNKRSGPVCHHERDVGDVAELHSSIDEKRSSFADDDSPDVKAVISETPTRAMDACLIIDEVMGFERRDVPEPLTPPYTQVAGLDNPGDMLAQDESLSTDFHEYMTKEPSERGETEGTISMQYPAAESQLLGSVKEADQPSPNSILEASFEDDLSSDSDCFERVSADLQGLRMQLQLLKQGTQAYNEGPMPMSCDEDPREVSSVLLEARRFVDCDEGRWVSSYFLDVLSHFGFDDFNCETLGSTCDPVGSLVTPHVFEKLDKKHSGLAETCSRMERRLLFDRISHGVAEILNQASDPHPWANRRKKTIAPPWDTDMLKVELWGLLKRQEVVEIEMDSTHKGVMESDINWMDFGGAIDGMGKEIEEQLFDELMGDFS
ncbi:hypothetical protein AKJ16_DCAP05671 [Drosera capensis]